MKFRLKLEYSFNSIDKRIYTYKLSQNQIYQANSNVNQDIRDKARDIIHSVFKWSITNNKEIILHKDEEYISQTLYIFIFLCMTKETHQELNQSILKNNKYVNEIQTKEDYTLTKNYLNNNYKKIIMCFIENILYMHEYEKIGNYFIREPLNIEYFNNLNKDDFHFSKNKYFKDLHTVTKFYMGYIFPDMNSTSNKNIVLEKIENIESYFLLIVYIYFQGGIIYFTECESTKKNIKILSGMKNYEFYNKKYLTRLKLNPKNNKLLDYQSKLMSNVYNYNSKILLRPPYLILSKSFAVMPYITKNIIEIINHYNEYYLLKIRNNLNQFLVLSLYDIQLTGYEEEKVNKIFNILEDDEKDFISDNIYQILSSFEEGSPMMANSDYSVKLNKLFEIYNINHFNLSNSINESTGSNNVTNENINIDLSNTNNLNENLTPLKKFYIDMIFRLELYKELFYYYKEENKLFYYNSRHEHIYNLKLIEFYFFIKELNTREKEKELKTIDTEDLSKGTEEPEEDNDVELPITEKYVQQLELSLTQNKNDINKNNNKLNDISLNNSLNESIIKQFDEDKIKICKNFKCNYGIEKEKKSSNYSRNQRCKKIIQNANKELEETYDNNYVKKKFNKNITVFNPELGKEGIYKDILQTTTLQ